MSPPWVCPLPGPVSLRGALGTHPGSSKSPGVVLYPSSWDPKSPQHPQGSALPHSRDPKSPSAVLHPSFWYPKSSPAPQKMTQQPRGEAASNKTTTLFELKTPNLLFLQKDKTFSVQKGRSPKAWGWAGTSKFPNFIQNQGDLASEGSRGRRDIKNSCLDFF